MCALTKFVKLFAVNYTKIRTNLKKIESFVYTRINGEPKINVTDRRPCFISKVLESHCWKRVINHKLNSNLCPQENGHGQVERVKRTLVTTMSSCTEMQNKSIDKSPFEVLDSYLLSFGEDGLIKTVSVIHPF